MDAATNAQQTAPVVQPAGGGFDPMVILVIGAVLFVVLVGFILYMRWRSRH